MVGISTFSLTEEIIGFNLLKYWHLFIDSLTYSLMEKVGYLVFSNIHFLGIEEHINIYKQLVEYRKHLLGTENNC